MKRIFLVCAWLCAVSALAIPAKKVKRTITLQDGTQKEVTLRGDENAHYYVDSEGNAYLLGSGDTYVLADKDAISKRWAKRMNERNEHRIIRAVKRGMLPPNGATRSGMHKASWGANKNPISGSKRGLVILVNYQDKEMVAAHSQSYYNDFFNQKGFAQDGMSGSVHDYFWECSYGQFDLTFDVVGPVTVSKKLAYYGANDSNGDDKYAAEMVIEACKLADKFGVDFSKYDWDGDGEVDQTYVVYAGYSEASGGAANTIWPHEFELDAAATYGDGTGALVLDGVRVNTYAVSSELSGRSGTKADGIGTACHEFSHCMCLPDMYDTGGQNFGMDAWDLMDCGSYNGPNQDGECPAPYTAYERMYCGWLTPTELSSPCVVSDMKPLATTPEAYIIYNEKNRNEYYLLENRQQVGFDKYAYGHGLLVVHVDFDVYSWINNTVNTNASRQRMTIIPADNQKGTKTSDLAGDPWPGTKKNKALTDQSKPAATLYTANSDGRKYMGKPIEDITENTTEKTVSFTFGGPLFAEAPKVLPATDIGADTFAANWQPLPNAKQYEIELLSSDASSSSAYEADLLFKEDFSKCNNGKSSDGMADISGSLSAYLNTAGWTGYKLFTTPRNELKMGSSSANGNLTTPIFNSNYGVVTMRVVMRAYGNETGKLNVKIDDASIASADLSSTEMEFVFVSEISTPSKITFEATCRAYLSDVVVYDGRLSTDELPITQPDYKIVESIRVNSSDIKYVFSGLDPSKLYAYRVRAWSDNTCSEWSEMAEVTLLADGIEVLLESGNENSENVKYYDLNGRLIKGVPQRGIYLKQGKKISAIAK